MAQILDARQRNSVRNPTALDVALNENGPNGNPLRMLILSGLAFPSWESRGNLDRELVLVLLGEFKSSDLNFQIVGQTSTVGLANINSLAGAEFALAAESVTINVQVRNSVITLTLFTDI